MAIIVQKFGGTSVADIERIKHVAELVRKEKEKGNNVAVVVSAMAGVTDKMVAYAKAAARLDDNEQLAEYDSILASGEQITSGLLALTLESIGIKARSWLGWQLPIKCDNSYSKARIENFDVSKILAGFTEGEVAVVAGFQGISHDQRIVTLGRGGSDTTAIALSASLNADRCDIYTDVDGVYTADPRIVTKAQKLSSVTYEEMLEMASLGAKVLQTRSVEIAMKYKVPVQVLSSFSNESGTFVISEENSMEKKLITGIAYNRNEAMITIRDLPEPWIAAAKVFGPLAEENINVDVIVQNISKTGGATDISFTVAKDDLERAIEVLENNKEIFKYSSLTISSDIAKVSVVGVGMKSHSGVAKEMFKVLAEKGVNILVISTSEIKISVIIPSEYLELALRALHTEYGLDAK
jgi:aspartate kinase